MWTADASQTEKQDSPVSFLLTLTSDGKIQAFDAELARPPVCVWALPKPRYEDVRSTLRLHHASGSLVVFDSARSRVVVLDLELEDRNPLKLRVEESHQFDVPGCENLALFTVDEQGVIWITDDYNPTVLQARSLNGHLLGTLRLVGKPDAPLDCLCSIAFSSTQPVAHVVCTKNCGTYQLILRVPVQQPLLQAI